MKLALASAIFAVMSVKINTNKERLLALQAKMDELKLDLVLVFSTVHDFAYGQFFCGFKPALYHYFFVRRVKQNKFEEGFFVPEFMLDLLEVSKKTELIAFNDQNIPLEMNSFLGKIKKIGLLGPAPVEHFSKSKADIVYLHNQIWPFLNQKTPEEIKKIALASEILDKNLEALGKEVKAGVKIDKLADENDRKLLAEADALAFPSIIVGNKGRRNFMNVLGIGNKIGKKDMVWINIGIEKDGFLADRGRMFFVGENELEKDYVRFRDIIGEFVKSLEAGMKTAQLADHLQRMLIKGGLIKYKLKEAYLGHNIGFSLFEEPLIGHGLFVDATLKNNMTISLNMEIEKGNDVLKIQEMAVISSRGGRLI
ncbi:aminopeptidase P family protein [Candidatus Peregrinibacteria bacterium]|nr:aminopeptidase P family protein [Candidatus Peregrinibacteria bacterium]